MSSLSSPPAWSLFSCNHASKVGLCLIQFKDVPEHNLYFKFLPLGHVPATGHHIACCLWLLSNKSIRALYNLISWKIQGLEKWLRKHFSLTSLMQLCKFTPPSSMYNSVKMWQAIISVETCGKRTTPTFRRCEKHVLSRLCIVDTTNVWSKITNYYQPCMYVGSHYSII